MGYNYDEEYFKSFAIKRFNDLTERKRKEGENPVLNRQITGIDAEAEIAKE